MSDNPYASLSLPEPTSDTSHTDSIEVDVDSGRLLVGEETTLPQRCVITNLPGPRLRLVRQQLVWSGRPFQVVVSSRTCQLNYYVLPRIRRQTGLRKLGGGLVIAGITLLLALLFGIDLSDSPTAAIPLAAGAIAIVVGGAWLQTLAAVDLRVVRYRDGRFWISGCGTEFLTSLRTSSRDTPHPPQHTPDGR